MNKNYGKEKNIKKRRQYHTFIVDQGFKAKDCPKIL